jgi:hypothetical protein
MAAIVVRGTYVDPTVPEGRMKLNELKAAAIRLRNFGATLGTITDTLGLETEDMAEHLLMTGLRELVADDADTVRARQQAVLNDIKRAMYPNMTSGDKDSAGTILRVLDHEAKLHPGVLAPQRVRVGLDHEAFTTTVDEDMRALGVHPQMDVPLEEGDEGWANT